MVPQQPHAAASLQALLNSKDRLTTTSKSIPNKFHKVDSSNLRTVQIFADAKETKPQIVCPTYHVDDQANSFTDDNYQCDGKGTDSSRSPCNPTMQASVEQAFPLGAGQA